jgi:hypothetical protein
MRDVSNACHHEIHPKYVSIIGAESKADNYRFIYAGSNRIGEVALGRSKDGERKGWLLPAGRYLSSLSHSRLNYFEEVRGIKGFV